MGKYLNTLNQKSDEKNAAANVLAEQGAKYAVETKLSELKHRASTLAAAYEASLGNKPLSIETIFGLKAEIEANESKIAVAASLLTELF